jgi:hypothetical protein
MTFSLEVRVKAETMQMPEAAERREEPAGCWAKAIACAVRTASNEKLELKLGTSSVALDQSTVILRVSSNELRLVSGTIWIRASEPVTVATEFGTFSSEKGEFWVWRNAERVHAASVESIVQMKPRGSKETLEIGAGLENWFSRIGPDGQARTGIPMAIELKSHLLRWAKLYSGSKANFEKEAQLFYEKWELAAEEAAAIHKELFDRKVASIRSQENIREVEHRKVEAHNRELRQMLWRHAFEE